MADPAVFTWLLGLPHLGGWANDGLIRLDQGTPPDFAYLACAAAAGAVRAGVPFELDVPVRGGHVLLPGLGSGCALHPDELREFVFRTAQQLWVSPASRNRYSITRC